jgi:CrcB protein
MLKILLVGSGGFVGSALRFLASGLAHRILPTLAFPIGTLVVNVLGCFALGLLDGFAQHRDWFSPQTRLFLFVGLLGGFTTFSAFSHETMALANQSAPIRAGVNVLLQVTTGLIAVWAGYSLARG